MVENGDNTFKESLNFLELIIFIIQHKIISRIDLNRPQVTITWGDIDKVFIDLFKLG